FLALRHPLLVCVLPAQNDAAEAVDVAPVVSLKGPAFPIDHGLPDEVSVVVTFARYGIDILILDEEDGTAEVASHRTDRRQPADVNDSSLVDPRSLGNGDKRIRPACNGVGRLLHGYFNICRHTGAVQG